MSAKHFAQPGSNPNNKPSGATARAAQAARGGVPAADPRGAAGASREASAGAARQASGYASPYTPPAGEEPYVAGPAKGAVGMKSEYVRSYDPRGRDARMAAQGLPGKRRRRRRRVPMIIVILVVLGLLTGGGLYFWKNPPIYTVTVNGASRTVRIGTTLQGLVDENYATPTAGDLIAVDGSVAKQGGGDKFEATINGGDPTSDGGTLVPRGADVRITDGNDVDEDYDEKTETVPHGDSSSGADMNSFNEYWAGPIHIYSDGQDGEQVTKTGKVSGKTVTEVTKQPIDAGYHVYTPNVGDDKVIALTFDDGPWPKTTSEILDVLKENGAKATFFEIGNQVAENADVVKRIHAEGHQIGSHTWDHAAGSGGGVDLTKMSADEQVNEVDKGFQAIEDTLGTQVSRVLRAPGGNYHGDIISTLKDHVTAEIGWNIDTEDWRKPGADKIAQAILSVKPGEVVLMHDGGGDRSETVAALKKALPELKAQGYKFVTIDELLAYGVPEGK